MTDTPTRAGFVALIGEPNAGKSTLLNRMVGAKVSIVTHKVQTTRTRIRGVAMEGQSQIVFVDTPGLFRPRRRLDRAMVKAVKAVMPLAEMFGYMNSLRSMTEGRGSFTMEFVRYDIVPRNVADEIIAKRK